MSKKNEIIELRKNGLTINEIVNKLGCAKSTVSYHINNENLGGNVNNFLFGITQEIIEKITSLRMDLKTYPEICKEVNISEDKLKKICRKYNLNKSANTLKKHLDSKEVIEYYNVVKSLRLTAKHFNTSRDTLRKIITVDILHVRKKEITKAQSVVEWRKRKKNELVEYKGGKCERCGYSKSVGALHFHHRNPNTKDFAIGAKSYSIERLKKEADKCILLCSNCHIEVHEEIKILKNKTL